MRAIGYARIVMASAYTLFAFAILLDLILSTDRTFNIVFVWIAGMPWTILLSAFGLIGAGPDEVRVVGLIFAYLINAAMIWWWAAGQPRHFHLPRR